MVICPNCKLANPDAAERCDCGFDFPSSRMKQPYLTVGGKESQTKTPRWLLLYGQEILVFAILVILFLFRHVVWAVAILIATAAVFLLLRQSAVTQWR